MKNDGIKYELDKNIYEDILINSNNLRLHEYIVDKILNQTTFEDMEIVKYVCMYNLNKILETQKILCNLENKLDPTEISDNVKILPSFQMPKDLKISKIESLKRRVKKTKENSIEKTKERMVKYLQVFHELSLDERNDIFESFERERDEYIFIFDAEKNKKNIEIYESKIKENFVNLL
jgi:hypothetical protein